MSNLLLLDMHVKWTKYTEILFNRRELLFKTNSYWGNTKSRLTPKSDIVTNYIIISLQVDIHDNKY